MPDATDSTLRRWAPHVLSLLRQHGALAKSDIARMTGLSAQTVSVIMRALEEDGLLVRRADRLIVSSERYYDAYYRGHIPRAPTCDAAGNPRRSPHWRD